MEEEFPHYVMSYSEEDYHKSILPITLSALDQMQGQRAEARAEHGVDVPVVDR